MEKETAKPVIKIDECYEALITDYFPDGAEPWVRSLTDRFSRDDIQYVAALANKLNPEAERRITVDFFHTVYRIHKERKKEVRDYLESVSIDWYRNPFYYAYVQYFGTSDNFEGDFTTLSNMLDYLKKIGIRNLYILPHYESPCGDNGYDVSDFKPSKRLGGIRSFNKFMKKARKEGFHVVTDAVFNHVSVEHEWFRKAQAGEEKYLNYFLLVDDWEYIKEEERNGDFWVTYRDSDGNIMERILIFPDVSRNHWLEFTAGGKKRKVYREFYPFQVDLNLQNPDVLKEIWTIAGNELNLGIMGKRTDAIAHWLKPRGRKYADGNPETFIMHQLFKAFIRLVSDKAIVIPEAVRSTAISSRYIGEKMILNSSETTDQGDAMFNFHAQGALRESLFFEECDSWWNYWGNEHVKVKIPDSATWLNLLGHHDEMYIGFIREKNREKFRKFIQDPNSGGGKVYKGGMSAGARTANCLNKNQLRIAMAHFLLYMIPGVPVLYYGDDIGWCNNWLHAEYARKKQHGILQKLGIDIDIENAFDPRELHRGPIRDKIFFNRLKNEYFPLKIITRLNELWNKTVISSKELHDLPCGDNGIFALEKFISGEPTPENYPVLAIANLTRYPKTAYIDSSNFSRIIQHIQGNFILFNQLIGTEMDKNDSNISLPFINGQLQVSLKPYNFILLGKYNSENKYLS